MDIMDLPRYTSIREFLNSLDESMREDSEVYCVRVKHSCDHGRSSPHFVLLTQKLKDTQKYANYTCTCSSDVRCGVPCRHFWAVYTNTSCATFHESSVNELWFREGHNNHNDGQVNRSAPPIHYVQSIDDDDNVFIAEEQTQAYVQTQNRQAYGDLLGEFKATVQYLFDNGLDHQVFQNMMRQFRSSQLSNGVLQNPPKTKHKGRPRKRKVENNGSMTNHT